MNEIKIKRLVSGNWIITLFGNPTGTNSAKAALQFVDELMEEGTLGTDAAMYEHLKRIAAIPAGHLVTQRVGAGSFTDNFLRQQGVMPFEVNDRGQAVYLVDRDDWKRLMEEVRRA